MPGELDKLYRQTLEEIQEQTKLMMTDCWVWELSAGLRMQKDHSVSENHDMVLPSIAVSPESLVDVFAGLVFIDSTSQIIHLVHHTTQEYFDEARLRLFKSAEIDTSRACLAYLS